MLLNLFEESFHSFVWAYSLYKKQKKTNCIAVWNYMGFFKSDFYDWFPSDCQ